MATKVTIYLDEGLRRQLRELARARGQSLSQLVREAVRRMAATPDRRQAAARMDEVRARVQGTFTAEELRSLRQQGRA